MRKVLKFTLSIVLFLLCLSLFIRRDIPPEEKSNQQTEAMANAFEYNLEDQKTVTIDGVDYLQTQAPIGKFGGKFVQSSIGEGPKTFNPWNSKDAFSSAVTSYMFDGLVTMSPYTGLAIPRLAKSVDILPDKMTYIVHLRKGLKWSDGKPITADDVDFTWNTIVFGGYGNTSTRDSMIIDGQLPKVEKIDNYTYKIGDSVYILIPGGDYKEKKFIMGLENEIKDRIVPE